MKTNLILLALIGQCYLAHAQSNGQQPFYTKSLKGEGIKQVFVNTSGGSITVSGTAAEQPRIEVYVTGNNGNNLSKEEAQKRIDKDYSLVIESHDGELHATAKSKRNFNWGGNSVSISFKVYVPQRTASNLNTSGGSIHIDNLIGNERFETSGGSLYIDRVAGMVKGETSGGSIHVSNAKDNVDLETSGGSIDAESCQGNIRLETSGGSISLNNLSGTIKAETSGGSIRGGKIAGEMVTGTSGGSINLDNLSCSLNASTSAGSLHAQFNQVGKYVKLDVSAGHIDLVLPSKQGFDVDLTGNNVSSESLSNFNGDKERDHIRGKINGGGIPVRADAGSGRVNLKFN